MIQLHGYHYQFAKTDKLKNTLLAIVTPVDGSSNIAEASLGTTLLVQYRTVSTCSSPWCNNVLYSIDQTKPGTTVYSVHCTVLLNTVQCCSP